MLYVDFSQDELARMEGAIGWLNVPGLIGWEGPLRSFGSAGGSARMLFKAYIDESRSPSDLDVKMLIRYLTSSPDLDSCIIGSRARFKDPQPLLMDVESVSVLTHFSSLMDGCVLVSRSLAVMRTSASARICQEAFTQHSLAFPSMPVHRIRKCNCELNQQN